MKRTILIGGGIALLLAIAILYRVAGGLVNQQPTIAPAALYAASFPGLDGMPQPLGQWRGKLIVLNFWATWCPPCREEIPHFIQAQQKFGARGVQVVGLALDRPAAVAAFSRETGINYPLLVSMDEGFAFTRSVGNVAEALPFTIVIDRSGHIVATRLGGMTLRQLERILEPLL